MTNSEARAPRLATLQDVATLAGVHTATASRALNPEASHLVSDETRQAVRTAAQQLGYRFNALAQSLRRGSTGFIGIVVADLANPYLSGFLEGVDSHVDDRRILPLVAETHDDPSLLRGVTGQLLQRRIDGLVITAAHVGDEPFIAETAKEVPTVLAVRGFAHQRPVGAAPRFSEIVPDDGGGARMAVEHLIDLGHRRLAQLPGTRQISSFVCRSEGYRSAIDDHPGVTDLSTGSEAIESSIMEGRRLATEHLRLPPGLRPTALFAHNDLLAIGALEAIRDAGLECPRDISLVGYNDALFSNHLQPPLTTVRLPGLELGRLSARRLSDMLGGGGLVHDVTPVPTELIERGSTAPPLATPNRA